MNFSSKQKSSLLLWRQKNKKKMDAFNSYDWSSDERWNVYKLNVSIPHDTSLSQYQSALRRVQKKYYKCYVDPTFESETSHTIPKQNQAEPQKFPEFKSPLQRDQQNQSTQQSSPPPQPSPQPSSYNYRSQPRSAPQPPPQPEQPSFFSNIQNSIQTQIEAVSNSSFGQTSRRLLDSAFLHLWVMANIFLLLNAILYIISFGSQSNYQNCLLGASFVFFSSLCRTITPSFRFYFQLSLSIFTFFL
jgi:FtsZ-interacting cell division protein ZipA